MIENVQNNHITHRMGMNSVSQADTSNRPTASDLDATVQMKFAGMVNQALQADETEVDAVQKARELLQTNRLTTPENIRSAAENLLTFGI
ncbi:MAG TPA: hypothetical protein PKH24_05985 [Sedimentisphaerales bacterium]|jgi:translation elongation factor EF-Ts|nr:hypothetical protein [Sedimentisphaerales bacterium]HNU27788.1 hypothetical protein [Sedimentisphaerales bacterium]